MGTGTSPAVQIRALCDQCLVPELQGWARRLLPSCCQGKSSCSAFVTDLFP